MLQAILIDMDGTLCESEEVHRAAFNRAFVDAGLPYRWVRTQYERLLAVKGGRDRLAHYLRTEAGPGLTEDAVVLARRLHARKTAFFTEALAKEGVPPRPGIVRLMAEARAAGVRLVLVTSATLPTATALVNATLGPGGLEGFDGVATGDRVVANKPAPDLYRLALKGLGLPPEACVAIEDDGAGLASARAAGLAVLVTPSTYTEGADFAGAAAVVPHLDAPPPDGPVDLAWLGRLLAGAAP